MDRATSLAWELVGRYLSSRERVRAAVTCSEVAGAMAATGISAPMGPCREYPAVSTETPACCEAVRAAIEGCVYAVRHDLADMVDDDPTHEECDGGCEEERYSDIRELVLAHPPPSGASIEFRTSCPIGPWEKLEVGEGPTFVVESLDLAAAEPADRTLFNWDFSWGGYYTDEDAWYSRVYSRYPRGPCIESSVDVDAGADRAARLSLSFGGCEDHPDARWSCRSFEASFGRFDEKWTLVSRDEHVCSGDIEDVYAYESCVRAAGEGRRWRRRGSSNMRFLRGLEARIANRRRVLGPCAEPLAERARYLALFARTIETLKRMRGEFPEKCRERFSRVPHVDESSIEYAGYRKHFRFFDGRVLRALGRNV